MAKREKNSARPASSKAANNDDPITGAGTEAYQHPAADSLLRPLAADQGLFRKKKTAQKYRYDDSLSPRLEWDEAHPARERGEALIRQILEADSLEAAKAAAAQLKGMSKPFLNWAGKAEKREFEVPTLPLFTHERLSTQAIIETLKGHQKQGTLDMFGDPKLSAAESQLKAYEHRDKWQNRMILGDSLVVMNSLLRYEGMGGQVQCIYMDPPYGVKFGSNFQPFVRKRDVSHGDDEDLTREPEMVQAYRDTWELGLHSYLSYLRDRLMVAKDLLTPTGSIFVQISDENLHHVREVMDEVFGPENFMSLISFRTKIPLGTKFLAGVADYIVWYARDVQRVKYQKIFADRIVGGDSQFNWIEMLDGTRRKMTDSEKSDLSNLPPGGRAFRLTDLVSSGRTETCVFSFEIDGRTFFPSGGKSWKTNAEGMKKLIEQRRVVVAGNTPAYVFYQDDYPVQELSNLWADTQGASDKYYVVQTALKVVERCVFMTTAPGDLVLDPTCGSGTTSYVAEQWGRRWITCDTSRVPLALARQRLLTATYDYYLLKNPELGPAGGFVYARKSNRNGEETGGIVPHVTLGSITNDEQAKDEIVVGRPEKNTTVTRVSGPFVVEATLPAAMPADGAATGELDARLSGNAEEAAAFEDRLLEVLRKVKTLRLPGNNTLECRNVRKPARSLSLSAEAVVDAAAMPNASLADVLETHHEKEAGLLPLSERRVAFVFGPENGAVSEHRITAAVKEANLKGYDLLVVIGFAIEPQARLFIERCAEIANLPAFWVEATRDLMMGDLLKSMRSSQVFAVCGLPEIQTIRQPDGQWRVRLKGLDVFDPITMTSTSTSGLDVPAWFLDTDYNERIFHVTQAFFPRTKAWESLSKALKANYDGNVWEHLAGDLSAPFPAGPCGRVAVKVIDDRGNELMVVVALSEKN